MQTYRIDNKEVKLKDDLTIEDEERVNKITSQTSAEGRVVTTQLTNDQLIELLAMISEGANGEQIDYRKVQRKVAAKMIRDFFLQEIIISKQVASILTDSVSDMQQLMTNTDA